MDPQNDKESIILTNTQSVSRSSSPKEVVSVSTDVSTETRTSQPPCLNFSLNEGTRKRNIIICVVVFVVGSGVLPISLFYGLKFGTNLSLKKILGAAAGVVAAAPQLALGYRTLRVWFLKGHEQRRPIGASRWGLDFLQLWINNVMSLAFISSGVGPFVTPSNIPAVSMALPLFILFNGIGLFITGLFPHKLHFPVRISSFPPNHRLPPLTYLFTEDVIAVEGDGELAFRQVWRERYDASPVMRKLLRDLSLFWGATGIIVGGVLIGLAWGMKDTVSFGICFGVPWVWGGFCTAVTVWWTKEELRRESREWNSRYGVDGVAATGKVVA